MTEIRNIAIIAHVDHGKTTLVGSMLEQSGIVSASMDSNKLEQERGITILSKVTTVYYNDVKINIVDTPGHVDFGGEVERVLCVVDGVVLLVDASEGPMPQTKFVLSKALALGLKPIVVINKIDRPDGRPDEVLNEIFDLFVMLGANDEQLDFPVLYGSGRAGWVAYDYNKPKTDLGDLFELVLSHVSPPQVDASSGDTFKMLVTMLSYDNYVGRVLIGKVYSGFAEVGRAVKGINLDGNLIESTKLTKLFGFKGIDRVPCNRAEAGDIVAIAGLEKVSVADTVCDMSTSEPVKATPIDPPTMSVTLGVNNSPFAGTEGSQVTSRVILDRLKREIQSNAAITLGVVDDSKFEIGGRGELQIGVLIETMRREGFELSVSKPKVLYQIENGEKLEPIEEVYIDVDDEFSGIVVEKLSMRKGEMKDMRQSRHKTRLVFHCPSRGLIGYQSEFRNDTRGTGVLSRVFLKYEKFKGEISSRRNGVLISNADGESTAYALNNLEDRGVMFITPKTRVYEGMIVGENNRDNDLDVTLSEVKALTNVRASGSDEGIKLTPCKTFTLEETLSYIGDDEVVEVTPKSIRLRKQFLSPNDRKRSGR